MYRLLALLLLTACIERTPTADPEDAAVDTALSADASADAKPTSTMCTPADCGPEAASRCRAGDRQVARCIADPRGECAWAYDCVPEDSECTPDDCGAIPPGEACGPGTEGRSDCRREAGQCTWFLSCEPVGCVDDDCGPFDGPEPDCEFVAECVSNDETGCGWRVTCVADTCALPWEPGPCKALVLAWWFNAEQDVCEQREYGGCEGNLNRFDSEEACWMACGVLGGE